MSASGTRYPLTKLNIVPKNDASIGILSDQSKIPTGTDVTVEATDASGAVVTFSATATDLLDGPLGVVCTSASGSTFPLGTTVVECTATNSSRAAATGSFRVTVRDTTAPLVTLTDVGPVEATSGAGALVTFSPTATDSVDPSATVGCSPASGSTFALGTTTVTCTATDAAGNVRTGAFHVTVVDTTAPAITVVGIPAQLWPPDHRLVRLKPTISSSDAVDAAPVVSVKVTSNEPDSGLGDGDKAGDIVIHSPTDIEVRAERSGKGKGRVYTVVWTITDSHGNARTATATVSVPHNQ